MAPAPGEWTEMSRPLRRMRCSKPVDSSIGMAGNDPSQQGCKSGGNTVNGMLLLLRRGWVGARGRSHFGSQREAVVRQAQRGPRPLTNDLLIDIIKSIYSFYFMINCEQPIKDIGLPAQPCAEIPSFPLDKTSGAVFLFLYIHALCF